MDVIVIGSTEARLLFHLAQGNERSEACNREHEQESKGNLEEI